MLSQASLLLANNGSKTLEIFTFLSSEFLKCLQEKQIKFIFKSNKESIVYAQCLGI